MRIYLAVVALSLMFFGCSSDETKQVKSKNSLDCQILKTAEVRCIFKTPRVNKTQGIEFHWISPSDKKDNRTRVITLDKNHATVYDERHTTGRASGVWQVKATLNGEVSSTSFRL